MQKMIRRFLLVCCAWFVPACAQHYHYDDQMYTPKQVYNPNHYEEKPYNPDQYYNPQCNLYGDQERCGCIIYDKVLCCEWTPVKYIITHEEERPEYYYKTCYKCVPRYYQKPCYTYSPHHYKVPCTKYVRQCEKYYECDCSGNLVERQKWVMVPKTVEKHYCRYIPRCHYETCCRMEQQEDYVLMCREKRVQVPEECVTYQPKFVLKPLPKCYLEQ